MAEFFKSAAQAGMEVRRLGQLPANDDRDPWLTELGKSASEGMQAVAPIAPRRGIAAPRQDSDAILQNYLSGAQAEDPADAIIKNYMGAQADEPEPAAPQSEGTLLGDVGRSVVRGGLALGSGVYELGNLASQGGLDTATQKVFGTSGTEAISSARQSLNQADSPELQRQRAELEQADGFWNSMGTVLTNPRLLGSMAVEMVPQMATVIGAAKTVATRTVASQLAKGATKEAAEKAAQRAATMTVLGVNPALEAGMAASDVRSSIMQLAENDLQASPQYQALLAQGLSSEDARGRLANDAATFAAIVAAPISLASNTITAGFEARLATGQIGKQFGIKKLAKEVGEGLIKEPIQEGIEEGGSQFGQNVGRQQAINPDQDLLAGVPEAAGAGSALGVVAGAGFGSANARFGLTRDPNAKPEATPAPQTTEANGSGTADRPSNLELTENQFNASLQSPRIVPFLTALWANSDEMTQTRIQELARRNNLMVDLAQQANNPDMLERGGELVRQSGDQFVSSFINTMNRELVKQDVTPLPPKTPEKTPQQLQQEFDQNEGFDVADNALASAEALGIEPRTQKGNDRAQPQNLPDQEVLLRGYQRRAENLSSQPLAARRAAAASSITEMIGRGFTADQAEAIFGPPREEAPVATNDTPSSTPDTPAVPEPIQAEPTPAPVNEAPAVEATPEPTLEPTPEPVVEATPTPVADATPQRTEPEPQPEPVAKEAPAVAKQAAPRKEEESIPNRPGTPGMEQDSPLGRARNPAIQSGTFRTESEPAADVVAQDQMRKEAKSRLQERLKQRPAELSKPRRRPRPGRQRQLGESEVDTKGFRTQSDRIMTQLVSPSAVRQRIADLDKALENLGKKRTQPRSEVEYIFGQFAQAGALAQEEMDDLNNQERNREIATSLRNKINDLQSRDLANRAEAIKLNIQSVEEALADLRAEMEDAGVPQNIIDDIILAKETGVRNVLEGRTENLDDLQQVVDESSEEAVVNEELFGDAAQAAAQIVDAIGNEVDTPRVLAVLKAEAQAAGVGNLDIFNEMRLRGIEIPAEVLSFASRPGVRYSLDFWMKKNEGRSSYTVRDEWLGSLDQTLRDLDGRKADQESILGDLTTEETKLLKDWRKQRSDVRNRLKERIKKDGVNEYQFDSLEDAFPHVLFNKYPLSSMFDVSKLPDADRPTLLALVGGDADALPGLWYSDVHAVLTARSDMEGQIQETLSESEYAQYQEWRNRQIRIELASAKTIAQSPAFSQLFQLQSLLDPETYEGFRSQISAAQQNQLPSILQAAYELAEQQRAALEAKQNVDEATDAVMDAVYSQDETHESAVEAPAVPDTDGELNESNEQMADEGSDPAAILDRLKNVRFKRGRYSGVTIAADIFAHINKITSGWNRAPQFQVLNSVNQLPKELREQALAKLGTQGAKGMMGSDGQVYIFSDFIENLEDAEFVFFHEIYGHHGLRAFLGDKLNPFLENQYKTNQRVRAEADKLIYEAEDSGRGMSKLEAIEEAIADLTVGNQEPGLFVQIMQALKKFFRSIGMNSVAKWMDEQSHKDLAFVLSNVRKAVRNGELSPMEGAPEDVRFVANQNPVEIFVTRNGKTNVYGMYNALTGNWTVFYNPNGLESNNYGIQTFDSYSDALAYARQYGKVISTKDHPRRQPMGPGDFNKVSIKPPSDVTGWKAYARRSNITFVKKLLPILEVVEQVKAQGGQTNLWQAITLYRGRIKPHFDKFRREFLRPIASALDTIKTNGDSYKFDGVEYAGQDLLDLYLLALHAQERNETVESIDPNKKDGSGLKTAEANKILSDLANTKSINELAQVSRLMQRLSKMKINYMLHTNLINEAQAAALGKYLFYVNLSGSVDPNKKTNESVNKEMLGGRSINLRGNDIKRALGRETMPIDILENTMNNYLGVVLRGQKNIVAQSVYDMVVKNPDPSFAVVNPFAFIKKLNVEKLIADKNILRVIGNQPTVESGNDYLRQLAAEVDADPGRAYQVAGQIYRRLEEAYQQGKLSANQFAAYSQKIENAAVRNVSTKDGSKTEIILSPEGYVSDVLDVDKMNRDNVFVVKIKGKPIAIELMEGVDDREAGKIGTFASALHGINNEASSAFSEAVGTANRWIGQLITSRNLAWVPVNWMRDIGTAYFNAAADPRVGKDLARKMFKRAPGSYAVAFKNLISDEYANETGPVYSMLKKMGGKPVDADTERMWNEFVNSGAQVFFMDRKDMKTQIEEMQRELNPRGGLLGTWDAYGRFADFIGIPAEASARFATYSTLREAGWSVEDAAVYAKEITVNFEQTGSWRAIRNYFMFANPAIQGNARMFRDLVTKTENGIYVPNPKFLKLVGALAGFGFVMGFVARAMGDNGEDEVNDLDKIPRYKRATSVVIVPGMPFGSPVPMPYGWNVFYALGNFAADSMFGSTPATTSAGRVVSTAIDAFWPLGQSESGTILGTALKVFTPTLASPIVDIAMNESKFGGPIAKEDNPFVKSEEANAYMNFNSASPISVWMARGLNELTGGNQFRSGGLGRNALDRPIIPMDLNPAYVDYLFASYLPGPFTDIGRLANLSINTAMGKDIKNPPVPLVDRFGSRISEGWDAGAFRRASTFLETKVAEAKAAPKEQRDAIVAEHPNLGPAKDALATIDQQIRNMRSHLRTIEANPNVPSRDKVEARNKIQTLEKEYYKRGVSLAIKAGFKPQIVAE
jgi:hypothetical protein